MESVIAIYCGRCNTQLIQKDGRPYCPRCGGGAGRAFATRGGKTIAVTATKPARKPRAAAPEELPARVVKAKNLRQASDDIPEKVIQRRIQELLFRLGWLCVRFNSGGFKNSSGHFYTFYQIFGMFHKYQSSGFPDLCAFRGSTDAQGNPFVECLMIEVKSKDGKLRPAQERFIDFAAEFGIPVIICDDWLDVEQLIKKKYAVK